MTDDRPAGPATSLLTDHYELTALDAARQAGITGRRAVFEAFARDLPDGRRYGVVAGIGRLVDAVARFRFGPAERAFLAERSVVSADTIEWLADFRFTGRIDGYPDGEVYVAGSPVVTVDAPFGEALVLETLVLSILNHDAAIASAASRMVDAAGRRFLIEGGARRTHEEAAVAAALAAATVGFDVTSDLEAGRRHGLPTAGTTMHAFTMAFGDERAAFDAQVAAMGPDSTFLVDTYDIAEGIRHAVAAAGPGIGAIRIDSGDLREEAFRARALLDELGATGCRIVVSGDLDEHRIAALADAPVDRYLLGTRLVTGSGAPTAELVYKLVAIADQDEPGAPLRPVAKASSGKESHGGRKVAHRVLDADGRAVAEEVVAEGSPTPVRPPGASRRPLQVPLVVDGEPTYRLDLADARARHERAKAELPDDDRRLDPGPPTLDGTPGGPA